MGKNNEAVGMNNRLTMSGGENWLVCTFRRQEFWKCIGCILLTVNYGNKGHNIWSEIIKNFGKNPPVKLQRYVCGNTDSNRLCCDIYRPFYYYACH